MATRSRNSFGAIELLPSGRFRVRYRADGRMHRAPRTFDSKSDARKYLDTVRADLIRETWQAPRRVTDTVESYGNRWLRERIGIKASTRAGYEVDFRLHVVPQLGHFRLDELRPDMVRSWYADNHTSIQAKLAGEQTQSAATVRNGSATAARAYRVLRAIYNTAVEDGLVVSSPCRLKGAGIAKPAERPTLSVQEIQQLTDAVPARYAALVQLLAWSGARIGELAIVRVGALDLDPRVPRLCSSPSGSITSTAATTSTPRSPRPGGAGSRCHRTW